MLLCCLSEPMFFRLFMRGLFKLCDRARVRKEKELEKDVNRYAHQMFDENIQDLKTSESLRLSTEKEAINHDMSSSQRTLSL